MIAANQSIWYLKPCQRKITATCGILVDRAKTKIRPWRCADNPPGQQILLLRFIWQILLFAFCFFGFRFVLRCACADGPRRTSPAYTAEHFPATLPYRYGPHGCF